MALSNYTTLQTAVANWLNRPNDTVLAAAIPDMIAMAEARFNRDPKVRRIVNHGDLDISAQVVTLPAALKSIIAWRHMGQLYYGALHTTTPDKLAEVNARAGASGVPSHAARIDDASNLWEVAPAPNGTFTTSLIYWGGVPALSASGISTSNWLLVSHPDIYLYGTLVQSAPWLKHDERLPLWEDILSARIEELHQDTIRRQWGGDISRDPSENLGEVDY